MKLRFALFFVLVLLGCSREEVRTATPPDPVWGNWSTGWYSGDGEDLFKETYQFFPSGKVIYFCHYSARRQSARIFSFGFEGTYSLAPLIPRDLNQLRAVTILKSKEMMNRYEDELYKTDPPYGIAKWGKDRWLEITGRNVGGGVEDRFLHLKNVLRVEGTKLYSGFTPHGVRRDEYPESAPIDVVLEHPFHKQ